MLNFGVQRRIFYKNQCLLWITLRQKKGEKKFQMKDNFRGDENDLALPDSRRRSL